MNRDKQIDEMAKTMLEASQNANVEPVLEMEGKEVVLGENATKILNNILEQAYIPFLAEKLTDKGYRKASEVAREIFEEVEKCVIGTLEPSFIQLRDKYINGELKKEIHGGKEMKKIIDVCCGSKMFWFDKMNPNVEFCDKREVPRHEYYPNRYLEVKPDTVCDFTNLPFEDNTYYLAVFDPPHLTQVGDNSWTKLKYGRLDGEWKQMLSKGFEECMRVLKPNGILIFKWSEVQVPLSEILPLFSARPLFGNRSGKHMTTHWLCFMKESEDTE